MGKMKFNCIVWGPFIISSIISPFQVMAEGMGDICILEKGTLVIAVPSKEGLVYVPTNEFTILKRK